MVTRLAQAVNMRCLTECGPILPAFSGILLPERKNHITAYAFSKGGEPVSNPKQPAQHTFVLLWDAGPAWTPGKTSREQAWWDEHAAFMDRLFEQGMVILGGPFADTSGGLVIVQATNEQEVADVFARDPFVINGIFALRALKQWHIFLDARRGAGG